MSRVLIVDDERNVLKTLSLILQRHDYSVLQAQNGPDALRVLDQEPCDFVVSDIRMSPMDGYTLASLIHQKYPQIGIVFMSAFGFEDQNPASDQVMHYPKLTKPFSVSDLIKILKEEEERIKKQEEQAPDRIVVIGEEERNRDIVDGLRSLGFDAKLVQPDPHIAHKLQHFAADLFLLDETVLTGEDWRVLNTIDQLKPQKPVMLLSDHSDARATPVVQDMDLAVLNRKNFFEDLQWTRTFIRQHVHRRRS